VAERCVPLTRLVAAGREAGRRVEPAGAEPAGGVGSAVHDSRQVEAGALFFCVPGERVDGHDFAAAAVAAGARALVVERELPLDVAQLVVDDVRLAMGPMAAAFWDWPARHLQLVGVTGTNGKTTTATLLAHLFESSGRRAAVLGTLTGARTTPEAPELQATLARLVEDGCEAVAMEVSSHALALGRVEGVRFDVAVFTNLGRDHLDFHGTMERYFAAKARLFEPARCERAVVNLDDVYGRLLADAAQVPTLGYSLGDVEVLATGVEGTRLRWRGCEGHLGLVGSHNLSNAVAALTVATELGIEDGAAVAALTSARPAPGRFELVTGLDASFGVVVDFAHTPDALAAALGAAREVVGSGGRVIAVFGCGGDRDPSKRMPMGETAARLADVVVVTSDNPRDEDPERIIDSILEGVDPGDVAKVTRESDRRAAIALALRGARPGDVVVIAGKGHETTQTVAGRRIDFDDRVVAAELLGARR